MSYPYLDVYIHVYRIEPLIIVPSHDSLPPCSDHFFVNDTVKLSVIYKKYNVIALVEYLWNITVEHLEWVHRTEIH